MNIISQMLFCEYLCEKWPRYNGTALYIQVFLICIDSRHSLNKYLYLQSLWCSQDKMFCNKNAWYLHITSKLSQKTHQTSVVLFQVRFHGKLTPESAKAFVYPNVIKWCEKKCISGPALHVKSMQTVWQICSLIYFWSPVCLGCWAVTLASNITMTSLWAQWLPKSPASWLFAQTDIQAQIKENIKAPRTGLCARNSSVTSEFPAQSVSNIENVSIWLCHRG